MHEHVNADADPVEESLRLDATKRAKHALPGCRAHQISTNPRAPIPHKPGNSYGLREYETPPSCILANSFATKKSRLSVSKRESRYVSVLVSLVCFCIALRAQVATFDMFFCLLLFGVHTREHGGSRAIYRHPENGVRGL